jgi:uncharacterized protein (DUF433 family)
MSSATSYPGILLSDSGVARIGATRYSVEHLAAEHYAYGWTAEELLRQHPDLRPQEVYAALAYFYDHFDQFVAAFQLGAGRIDALRVNQSLNRQMLLDRLEETGV